MKKMVKKRTKEGWVLYSRSKPKRKLSGPYPDTPVGRKQLRKRERQVQFFKRKKTTTVKTHKRKNPKRIGKHTVKRHPRKIGSVWKSKKYVHGPRQRQPEEFERIYNFPIEKAFKMKHRIKGLPKRFPTRTKYIVVGELKDDGLAVQSYIRKK